MVAMRSRRGGGKGGSAQRGGVVFFLVGWGETLPESLGAYFRATMPFIDRYIVIVAYVVMRSCIL